MADLIKEYGKALYELSEEDGQQSDYLGEIRFLRVLFHENPGFLRLLRAPNIPKTERMEAVDRVFGGRIEPCLCSFMKLMIKRGHAARIPACFDEYERLWYRKSGIAVAEVTSAVPLTSEQKNRLLARLESETGQSVEMRCTVDPALLGGLTVMIDGRLIEGSIRGKLASLREHLSETTI